MPAHQTRQPPAPEQKDVVAAPSHDRLVLQRVLALLGGLGGQLRAAFVSRVDASIVGNSEVLVIATLDVEGELRPSRITELTGIGPSGVTKLLDRLEGHGLIVREVGSVPGDRRGTRIVLTAEGRRVAEELAAALEEHIDLLREVIGELQEVVGD